MLLRAEEGISAGSDRNRRAKESTSETLALVEDGGDHFVVLDEQRPGVFHGHQRDWNELSQDQKNTLIKNKITDVKGRLIKNKD